MTSVKCKRCAKWWTIATLYPDTFHAIARFCPDCIPYCLPLMGVIPLQRRPA
jgi:hypothetical protein